MPKQEDQKVATSPNSPPPASYPGTGGGPTSVCSKSCANNQKVQNGKSGSIANASCYCWQILLIDLNAALFQWPKSGLCFSHLRPFTIT